MVESGKNVTVGILEEECNELNKRFLLFIKRKRPYIILKWAETADGFIAPISKEEKVRFGLQINIQDNWFTNGVRKNKRF